MKKAVARPRIVSRTAASSASRKSFRWWPMSDQSFETDGVDRSRRLRVGFRSMRMPVQWSLNSSGVSFLLPRAGSPIVMRREVCLKTTTK